MRKLFLYYLNQRKNLLMILSCIFTLYTLIMIDGYNYINERSGSYIPTTPPIYLLTSFGIILSIGIPIYEFNFKMNKIDIDEHYKLPIKKEKLFITKFLIGLVEIIIPLTIVYIFIVLNILMNKTLYHNIYLIPFYFLFMLACSITYTFICFVYTRNNNTVDGAIMIFMYSILLPFIVGSISEIFALELFSDVISFTIYQPLIWVNSIFQKLMTNNFYQFELITTLGSITSILLAIIGGILFIKLIKYDKSEDASSISNSWFSYKTIVPIFTFVGTFAFDFFGSIVIIIGSYIFYVIKNRSLKISNYELIAILCCLVGGQLFHAIYDK